MTASQRQAYIRTRNQEVNHIAAVTLTRPSNVLPYTAGDVIGSNGGSAALSATTTQSNGTPCVITWGGGTPAAHGMSAGQAVIFKTAGGTIAAGLTDDTLYYVVIPVANPTTTFTISDTKAHALAGTNLIASTGTGTGVTTCAKVGSAVLEFPNMAMGGEMIRITQSNLMVVLAAIPADMAAFRLHLYGSSPASALLDNVAWTCPSGDASSYLGYIDCGSVADIGDVLFVQATGLNKEVVLPGSSLYGYLQTIAGYTPTSGAVLHMKLFSQSI